MAQETMVSRDPRGFNRRKFIVGAGAAAAVTTATAVGGASPASAAPSLPKAVAVPEPINGGVQLDPSDPSSLIHWLLPGPEGFVTQIIGLPAMGLDVDPSTVGNFNGAQAYAVVAGKAKGSDGETYDCEFDVRAMEGSYVAADGVERRGAFAFM
ncbi:MAG: hypothetical protein ACR2QK_12900 [Acidimicrobiales bacterium]